VLASGERYEGGHRRNQRWGSGLHVLQVKPLTVSESPAHRRHQRCAAGRRVGCLAGRVTVPAGSFCAMIRPVCACAADVHTILHVRTGLLS
jgi:hypothetical protein